jgi:hypothetical protein
MCHSDDTTAITERLLKSYTEAKPRVFNRVMSIYVKVSDDFDCKVK